MLFHFIIGLLVLILIFIIGVLIKVRKGRYFFPKGTVGFLHPSAAAGGGGERVLWIAISALQENDINKGINRRYVLYCTKFNKDDENKKENLEEIVHKQFRIKLLRPIEIVYLRPSITKWLNGDCYPFLTLILQLFFGSILLFYETCIINNMTPIIIESVGIPGIYPLLSIFVGSHIITYTHYPVITSIMTQRVENGEQRYNNRNILTRYYIFRKIKVFYYKIFAYLYRWLGQFPLLVMTNSQWTMRHIQLLWAPIIPKLVYPPCAVNHLTSLRKLPEERNNCIVSVGQFRPEKNHMLQLRAFAKAIPQLPLDVKLIMIGGARGKEDQKRATKIIEEAKKRGISDRVEVRIGAPFNEVCEMLTTCCIGLHTMEDEHFGIVIVEYIAAGCIPLAHNSGGVSLDIITSTDVGFLASTEEEYAKRMVEIMEMKLQNPLKYERFQERGLHAIRRFSDESFRDNFISAILPYLKS